jgi:hypothetical protein
MRPIKKIILIVSITIGLTSCFYSTNYVVTYHISSTTEIEQTTLALRKTIADLSLAHKLTVDNKYAQTDTFGFFGNPYHYFKYWTDNQDSTITLTLKYNGVFGKRKSPPYDTLLTQLSTLLNQEFNVTNVELQEKSNRKPKSPK